MAFAAVFAWPLGKNACGQSGLPPVWGYKVVNVYPHDREAYTQGLVFADGFLYEGTGQYESSTLRKVELKSGKVVLLVRLNRRLFGEGIAILGGKIYQLTWQSGRGLIFDQKSFKYQDGFQYSGEGWGLTHDGTHLILSDGTPNLRFLDPKTFKVVKTLQTKIQGKLLKDLNELEYIGGEIYANIYHTDYIARISPKTGEVLSLINLAGLLKPEERPHDEAVLNGIAYDPKTGHLFVTGKDWPKMFEIELIRPTK